MTEATRTIGILLRKYREEARLTQYDLAEAVGVSRTSIALQEQGRRSLGSDAAQRVAEILGIPPSICGILLPGPSSGPRSRASGSAVFSSIAISGGSGSGKTSIANMLARSFAIMPAVGSARHGRDYLADLQADKQRWALETQVAFVAAKALEIRSRLDSGSPVIVERSISEDVRVYARHFMSDGSIDERGTITLRMLEDIAHRIVPVPDVTIFCRCTPVEAHRRIEARSRTDQKLHTLDYLESVDRLYSDWLRDLSASGFNVYEVDTEKVDVRDPANLERIYLEVEEIVKSLGDYGSQLDLFQPRGHHTQSLLKRLSAPISVSAVTRSEQRLSWPVPTNSTARVKPIAYLAAPFSGHDTVEAKMVDMRGRQIPLVERTQPHGIMPKSGMRSHILQISKAFEDLGMDVFVPHRDINRWGRVSKTPAQAFHGCSDQVAASELFVGVLGSSCGAHYEFGLARGLGIPCVLIRIDAIQTSFIGSGVDSTLAPDCIELRARSSAQAARIVRTSPELASFLAKHLRFKAPRGSVVLGAVESTV